MNEAAENRLTAAEGPPILVIPFMWIGDFVRCQSVYQVLKARFPDRPIDIVSTPLCAPLTKLMPEVRDTIVVSFPRGKLALSARRAFARKLSGHHYGSCYLMLGTLKDGLVPWLAGIPERVGWVGEWRYGLLTDARRGEKRIGNLTARCIALALPKGMELPDRLPAPRLAVTPQMAAEWRARNGLGDPGGPIVAMAPGCNDPERTWPLERYAELARLLTASGHRVVVMGGPAEKPLAAAILARAGSGAFDGTGTDLYEAALQAAAADVLVANDSGLLHVGAATGTRSIAIYGGSSHAHTGPLNANVWPLDVRLSGEAADWLKIFTPARLFDEVRAQLGAA
ncbi:MAG: lipopolysaccharide heptosyltransferase II [Rhodobiaceae bacterium]|nr:lipopolysaccharide heptosyltransferase II [Rhodobiaceae bacterium]MCC0054949.1 lipopolysaccharide heptosyltransferase II [Rhodobiaceae bacterium]